MKLLFMNAMLKSATAKSLLEGITWAPMNKLRVSKKFTEKELDDLGSPFGR